MVAEHASAAEAKAWMRDPANQWRRQPGSAHKGATDAVVAVIDGGHRRDG